MENNIYYIYNNFPLVVCPSVCPSVSKYARKPFCFVFCCKGTAIIGKKNPFLGKNTQKHTIKCCKVLKMRGAPPKIFFRPAISFPSIFFIF